MKHHSFAVLKVCIGALAGAVLLSSAVPAQATPPVGSDAVGDAMLAQELQATRGQSEFSDFLGVALEKYPGSVIDFAWEGSFSSILVAPEATDAVEALVSSREANVVVNTSQSGVVPYLKRSSVELPILTKFDGVDTAAMGVRYDPKTGGVAVTAWTDNPGAVAERAKQISKQERDLVIAIEYKDPRDAPRPAASHGGEAYSGCTGGFMATYGSAYGITTAAHCTTKPTSYDGSTTGATYVASDTVGNYDVRFTTLTGSTAENKIRIDASGTLRAMTSTAIVSTGVTVFRYGMTTGYGAAKITRNEGCVKYTDGKKWCGLFSTNDLDVVQPGDSGGPWFVGFTGYAFTSGFTSSASFITPVGCVSMIPGTVKVKVSR